MVRIWVTALAAGMGFATAVMAADLPAKTAEAQFEAPPAIPVFSWGGLYAGMHAGYGFGRDNATLRARAGAAEYGYSPHGVMGGLHVGYNYVVPALGQNNGLVVGVEGDIDGADYQRTNTPFGSLLGATSASFQSDIKGSLRGRIGIGINRALFYATGGVAIADFTTRYNATPAFGPGAFDAFDNTRTGYTVGGGVEYAFMNYLSVRAEYRYTNYGTFTDTLSAAAPGLNATIAHHETDNRLEAGISYKFESIVPAPVVARY